MAGFQTSGIVYSVLYDYTAHVDSDGVEFALNAGGGLDHFELALKWSAEGCCGSGDHG